MLRERGAGHIRVFGGGGGTITQAEIAELEGYGVERIYHPNDGMKLGLTGMIDDLVRADRRAARVPTDAPSSRPPASRPTTWRSRGCSRRSRTGCSTTPTLERLREEWAAAGTQAPVVGITGTGGAGKSTVTDELLSRFMQQLPTICGSRCWRSTRRAGAPAARCSATGSA